MGRSQDTRSRVIGACLFLVLAASILLLARGLYPADLPLSRNPDFIDNVFHNRAVLWAARLLLVSAAGVLAFGGIFIVISVGARMKNGEWLRRAGPFEISEGPLDQSEDRVAFWQSAAGASREEADALRERLRRSEELLEDLRNSMR